MKSYHGLWWLLIKNEKLCQTISLQVKGVTSDFHDYYIKCPSDSIVFACFSNVHLNCTVSQNNYSVFAFILKKDVIIVTYET